MGLGRYEFLRREAKHVLLAAVEPKFGILMSSGTPKFVEHGDGLISSRLVIKSAS